MFHEVFFIGPLRVTLDGETGEVVSVQDRLTGLSARASGFPADLVDRAITQAHLALASLCDA